jgi:hypothetical protein
MPFSGVHSVITQKLHSYSPFTSRTAFRQEKYDGMFAQDKKAMRTERSNCFASFYICQVLQPFKDIETWQWYVGLGGTVWAMERLLLRTSRAHGMGHYAEF